MKNEALLIGGILFLIFRKKRPAIGAIYAEIPDVYACGDGTFSTSQTSGACRRHGGRKSNDPVNTGRGGSGLLNIQDVLLTDINVDRALFQGREKAFSKRSVENIVNDAMEGRFIWDNLDPITLWRDAGGKLFLLSGHSRLEAFTILSANNLQVEGKGFNRIPAKIRTGSLQQAQKMALESNTLSTKETDIERASYYRRLRQDGEEEKKILASIKKNEGRNWSNIYAYTFLSPSGKTWAALRQFAEGEDQSANMAKSLAKWIGAARRAYPDLTAEHETELYNWLFEQRGYGTGAGQVSNEREFNERLAVFIQKNTFFGQFDYSRPLNIQAAQQKSPVELEFDRAIAEKTKQIQDLEKELKQKIKSLSDRNAKKDEISRIVQPLENALRNARVDYAELLAKKDSVIEYSKREATLFGIGKYYDDDKIKPGSRVDQFWGNIEIVPKKLGVESLNGKQYTNVTSAITHFNLYSIEFGNWLNQAERLEFMYASLVTLRDMATVVGVRQDQMGLKKTLSLAFGSRGRGGRAAAFYQPRYQVINLTKTMGRGTLCHEYAHAVDFYLGGHSDMRSTRKQPDYSGKRKDSAAWLFEAVLDGVLWNEDGNPSTYHKWLSGESKYYNLRAEIFARICEVYFINGFKEWGIKNTWGVSGHTKDLPDKRLVLKVAPLIKRIFQKI